MLMHSEIPPTADLSGPNASALAFSRSSKVLSPDQAVSLALRPSPRDVAEAEAASTGTVPCNVGEFERFGWDVRGGAPVEDRTEEVTTSWGTEPSAT